MKIRALLSLVVLSVLVSQGVAPNVNQAGLQTKQPEPPKIKSMEDVLKGKKEIPGLFTLYQDTSNGKLYMLIKEDQIGKEWIHFVHGLNGQINAGVFKGSYRGARVIKLNKYFNRIDFEIQNNSFWFDPENPLSRASDANISTAILASSYILAKKDKTFIIGIDDVFLTESLHQISRGFIPGGVNKNPFKMGRLIKNRTKYNSIKNYPENTDISVQYVYSNPTPTNWGSDPGLTDPRSVNVTIQHSFIQMPVNDFVPRFEDPRVGYFTTQVTDMTSAKDVTPYRDLIHRWNLVKKIPGPDLSEPIEPIVWWIENTTPHEFRDAIQEGVLAWNKAFEKAGFENAIQVKIQPDNADWDAGDIRYNVLRWTSSPTPPFGGYGPSFVNPRTGQILGADIMLEYVYFTNRVKYEQLNKAIGAPGDLATEKFCLDSDYLQQGNLFGMTVLGDLGGFSPLAQHRLIYESLVKLTLHEVGHTIGLNHNFYASHLHSLQNIHDRNITEPIGLTSSVMDYVPVNVNKDTKHHGQFYSTTPGPYDIWAIEFGYTPSVNDPISEKYRLKELLSKSTKNALGFGNDADDMRSPGYGIDPRIMIGDMSDDPMGYAQDRMEHVRALYKDLRTRYENEDESYHAFTDAFNILNREYASSADIISRFIGGVYMDRSMVGQEGRKKPFTPVPETQQKWAMTLLKKYIFSPNAFDVPEKLYDYLMFERRGFSGTNDPKIHDKILGIQKRVLNQLLHHNLLKRVTDTQLYGNNYTLSDMMTDLTEACFSSDMSTNVNTIRINLQTEYTNRIINIVHNKGKIKYDHITVATAYENLNRIKKLVSKYNGVDEPTKAHRKHLIYLIDKALDT